MPVTQDKFGPGQSFFLDRMCFLTYNHPMTKKKKHALKTYFFTGLLVTAPIAMTFYLAIELFNYVDGHVMSLIPAKYNPETYLPYGLPGLGVVLLFLFLVLVGMMTANFVGQSLVQFGRNLIEKMPIISGLYSAFRKIIETLLGKGQNTAFRKAVLIEYPRKGLKTIAFITGPVYRDIQKADPEKLISVYVPTTPNPTSGFLLYVPKKEVIPLKIGVDEALKIILSMGIVNPAAVHKRRRKR